MVRPGLWAPVLCLFVLSLFLPGTGHGAQTTLAWNANTESNLAGYKVYYGTASRDYDWFIDVGKVTTYTVTNLTDGVKYYFVATAYDTSNKESTYSEEVSNSTCAYSISPASATYTASASTAGSVTVTTQTGCSWTAKSGASWLTVTSGSTGSGNGTVKYSVAANTSTSSRSTGITIGGRALTVTQQGASSATTYTITASAGTGGTISPSGSVAVSKGTNKAFTITPNAGYRVSSVLVDGTSVGAVELYTFSNVTTNHTIKATFASCTYSISATSKTIPASTSMGSVAVTTQTGCSWTAKSGASWLKITSGSTGSASGTVVFSAIANTSTSSRTTTVTIGGKTLTVTQQGI